MAVASGKHIMPYTRLLIHQHLSFALVGSAIRFALNLPGRIHVGCRMILYLPLVNTLSLNRDLSNPSRYHSMARVLLSRAYPG